jgi:hypothetical protein
VDNSNFRTAGRLATPSPPTGCDWVALGRLRHTSRRLPRGACLPTGGTGHGKRKKEAYKGRKTKTYPRPALAGAINSPKAKRSGVGKPEAAKIGKKGRGAAITPTRQDSVPSCSLRGCSRYSRAGIARIAWPKRHARLQPGHARASIHSAARASGEEIVGTGNVIRLRRQDACGGRRTGNADKEGKAAIGCPAAWA